MLSKLGTVSGRTNQQPSLPFSISLRSASSSTSYLRSLSILSIHYIFLLMSLNILPYDLLFNIAQYLAIDDIHNLQAVSTPCTHLVAIHDSLGSFLDHRPVNRFGRLLSLDPSTVRSHMACLLALGPCRFQPSNASRTSLPQVSSRRSTELIVLKRLGEFAHLVLQGPRSLCLHPHPPHPTVPANGTQRYPPLQTKRSIGCHR
jgi:hypothetical protein